MTNTTHYNMTIAEGADVVNPLTQIFPNFNTIDGAMFANKQSGISTASEVTTGPVHAIVRANTDSNVFRFTATSAWTAGDTMTLDGNAVVVHMSDGTVPATGAYIIGAEVLAMVNSGLVTLAISSNGGVTSFNSRTGNVMPEASDYNASDIDFDNTNTTLTSTDVQGAIEEVSSIKSDLTSIDETGSTASQAIPIGSYFYLNGTLVRAKADIASGATFTLNTNYEVVTAGGLNDLSEQIKSKIPMLEETTITMSVAAGYTEHATYSFPEKPGYSRAMTVVQNLSGSGSATCSVHLNGAPWSGDVFVFSPSSAASLTITLRCLYLPSI